ncbi:MAG: S41 family peptidase [Bacilli bacterium]|nr:S41 family peptidase [Bacilli bacterium]
MKTTNSHKTGFRLVEVIFIMVVTTILGIVIGASIIFIDNSKQALISCRNDVLIDDSIKQLVDTYNLIINNYYEEVDQATLINSAIKSMLDSLEDPYSLFMDDEQSISFDDRMQGDYSGIGAEISLNEEGKVIVVKIFNNSPAQEAGLKPNDIIFKVDNKPTEGLTTMEVASLLKGKSKTKVTVTVIRDKQQINFDIIRNKIVIESVTTQTHTKNNKKIGYIKIDLFSDNTYKQFKDRLIKLENQKINSLIIDVRDNTGGYLNRVSEMISLFLDKNKVIYQLANRTTTKKIYSYTDEKRDYPIIVLINKYSASASEIMAAALKESYGATIVGEKSLGKGTVQQTVRLENGGMLKYTIQKWLTPKGNWINGTGIKPDAEVIQPTDYYQQPTATNDLQLQKALEILSQLK